MNQTIDINADLGEGLNNEAELMPYLSSCNIACGGHAGDEHSIRNAVQLAKKYNVKIGGHPSFPDRTNFGRQVLHMTDIELSKSLTNQMLLLHKIVQEEDCSIHHIKPHGALYNLAAKDDNTAETIVNLILSFESNLKLYAPYKSVIANLANERGLDVVYEAFADRNYNEDLSLVSRKMPNALITNQEKLVEHVLLMIKQEKVKTHSGNLIDIKASTYCIHGDNPKAIEVLVYLTNRLSELDIQIK